MLSDRRPVGNVGVLWPNAWMDQDGIGTKVGLAPGHIVLDGDPAPPPQKKWGTAPQFSAHVYCGQTAGCIKMPLSTEVSLGPGDIVLDWDPAPPKGAQPPPIFGPCILWPNGCLHQDTTWYAGRPRPRGHVLDGDSGLPPLKVHSPQFSAHLSCGQTAGWTKMPLGMEVGLGPGDFVLDGDPVPSEKGYIPHPIFEPCLLWPNGWMDQDATWYGGKPWHRRRCVRWGPSPLPKGPQPQFSACLLWPNGWMDEDATWYGSRPRPRPHCVGRGPSSPSK